MNLSEFALRIVVIFIPGLLSFNIVSKLTFHREFKNSDILLGSFTYGFICYLFYYFVFILLPNSVPFLPNQTFYFIESLTNKDSSLSFNEIFISSILGIPVGFLFAYLVNSKILLYMAAKLKLSNKLDDLGVWNQACEWGQNQWIVIRELDSDLLYRGWLRSFSDGLEGKEMLLQNVEVYRNSDSEHLYQVPGLYVSFNKQNNLKIEFQSWPFDQDGLQKVSKTFHRKELRKSGEITEVNNE
ncbi:MAG: hypothetical protein AAF693_22695 [Bacteroidota bacterium]